MLTIAVNLMRIVCFSFGFSDQPIRKHAVLLQSVRYKRVNLRKPRPPHFEAQKIAKLLSVKIPKPYDVDFPQYLKCGKSLRNIFAAEKEVSVLLTNEHRGLLQIEPTFLVMRIAFTHCEICYLSSIGKSVRKNFSE